MILLQKISVRSTTTSLLFQIFRYRERSSLHIDKLDLVCIYSFPKNLWSKSVVGDQRNNQDIQETQVRIAKESEKNPPVFSLEGYKSKGRKSSAKERQESFSSLISKLYPKSKKKRRNRESSTDSSSWREFFSEVTLYPAKKKKYGERRRLNHT